MTFGSEWGSVSIPRLVLLVLIGTVPACDRGTSIETGTVVSVEVTPSAPSLTVGSTLQLTATARDAAGNVVTGRPVTWASDADAVATVDDDGLVTAMGLGDAQVSATVQGITGTASVTVITLVAPVATVDVTPSTPSLAVGGTVQLTATARDAADNVIAGLPVDWASDAEAVATVDADGLVTAMGLGDAQVSATIQGVTGTASLTVVSLSSAGGVAELPRETVETPYLGLTGTVHLVAAGEDLQAALDAASRGDVVVLEAGATFTGNFELPAKAGTDWIYVVSSTIAAATFPKAPGERVSPADAGSMPRIRSGNSAPAIQAQGGAASYYRLVGLDIGPTAGNSLLYAVIDLGSNANAASQTPHHIIIDRCYVHGNTHEIWRGVALNSGYSAVIDSYFTEFHAPGNDTQAIMGWNGPGPYKIENNYLAGAGENIMFGGSDPGIPGLLPADIEIRRNHFHKPLSWQGVWNVKNLLEVKSGERILIEANVFENSWVDGQDGYALVLKSVNQDGGHNAAATRDITVRHNTITNVSGGFDLIGFQALSGGTVAEHLTRVTIVNNVFYDLNGGSGGVNGRLFKISTGTPTDIYIGHNTVFPDHSFLTLWDDGVSAVRLTLKDNIFGHGDYGLFGNGVGEGNAALAAYTSDATVVGNVLIGSDPSQYPSGNAYPSSVSQVGFVAFSSDDYRLSGSSSYKGQATDGTDPGADIDIIEAAIQGVKSN